MPDFRYLHRILWLFLFFSISPVFLWALTSPCPHCQFENTANDRYCLECGQAIRSLTLKEQISLDKKKQALAEKKIQEATFYFESAGRTASNREALSFYQKAVQRAESVQRTEKDLPRDTQKKLDRIIWQSREKIKALQPKVRALRGKLEVPLISSGTINRIDVVLNDKVKVRMILDTGASYISLSSETAARLDNMEGPTIMTTVADGRLVAMQQVTLKSVATGKARVPQVKAVRALDPGAPNLLGLSYLNHFNYSVNTERGLLILEPK